MKRELVIYGAGGLGREILSLINRDYKNEWETIGFIDDGLKEGTYVEGLPIFPKSVLVSHGYEKLAVVFGIADPKIKKKIYFEINNIENLVFPKIISKSAIIDEKALIEEGTVIADNCWVSINARIGSFCFLNVGNVIGHDVKISNFSSFMPLSSISGFVEIGECTLVGARSFILQGLKIEDNCVVGAGCSLFFSLKEGDTAITSPPHVIKTKN